MRSKVVEVWTGRCLWTTTDQRMKAEGHHMLAEQHNAEDHSWRRWEEGC